MAKKHLRKPTHQASAAALHRPGAVVIEVSARQIGHSIGWTVPAPVVRSHHLEVGSRGTMHVERDVRRHVVRYVIEVPEGIEEVRSRRPISWYLERAAMRGLGTRQAEEMPPGDAPKPGELW